MSRLRHLLATTRTPFLILTPACVLLGIGTAVWTSDHIDVVYAVLALLGAISAHISVNTLNEYFDFRSELDFHTTRTPFSGGSGTLPDQPDLARQVLILGLATLAVTGAIGLLFVWIRGWALLPLGLLGLVTIVIYTPWLAKVPLLCLIAPGLGFGPLMVMGTDFVLTGSYSWPAFVASLVPFFLVNDLLLLNQFPDVDADQTVARRHYPIVLGRRPSSLIYGAFLLLAFLTIIVAVAFGLLPLSSLIALIMLFAAVPTAIGAYRHATDTKSLMPYLTLNVVISIATPVLMAVGPFLA
jgi:1,4-dihydroxy-2-naphthoate octaprenyltransferase